MRLLFYLDNIIGTKDFVYFCGVKPSNMEKATSAKPNTNYKLTVEACKEADESEGTLFSDFEEFKCHIHTL